MQCNSMERNCDVSLQQRHTPPPGLCGGGGPGGHAPWDHPHCVRGPRHWAEDGPGTHHQKHQHVRLLDLLTTRSSARSDWPKLLLSPIGYSWVYPSENSQYKTWLMVYYFLYSLLCWLLFVLVDHILYLCLLHLYPYLCCQYSLSVCLCLCLSLPPSLGHWISQCLVSSVFEGAGFWVQTPRSTEHLIHVTGIPCCVLAVCRSYVDTGQYPVSLSFSIMCDLHSPFLTTYLVLSTQYSVLVSMYSVPGSSGCVFCVRLFFPGSQDARRCQEDGGEALLQPDHRTRGVPPCRVEV